MSVIERFHYFTYTYVGFPQFRCFHMKGNSYGPTSTVCYREMCPLFRLGSSTVYGICVRMYVCMYVCTQLRLGKSIWIWEHLETQSCEGLSSSSGRFDPLGRHQQSQIQTDFPNLSWKRCSLKSPLDVCSR